MIMVSDCPLIYVPNRRGFANEKEVWRREYGEYIIAYDSKKHIMFACGYQNQVWNLLRERCQKTAKYIVSEKEYLDYLAQRKQIEAKTEEKNDYQKIIDKFDGYVN